MNLQTRISKLMDMLANQRNPSAGSAPDAVGEALDRALAEGRGEDFHEAIFGVARELSTASVQGRTISIDEAFALAGVSGAAREQVEGFMELDEAGQVAFLDGLR